MILDDLSQRVGVAFSAIGLDAALGHVTPSQRSDLGQFQCNGAMQAAKAAKRSPREIANDVATHLEGDSRFVNVSIAGPGFLNFSLSDVELCTRIQRQLEDKRFCCPLTDTPQRMIIDYGGPNVAKAMHVGHLRASVIGESVKRIHKFLGHDVRGDIHLGDWGLPMGQLLAAIADAHPDWPWFQEGAELPGESPVTIDDLERLYPQASARCKEDPEFLAKARDATARLQSGDAGLRALWQHFQDVSSKKMRADLLRLGVSFELWKGEASVAHLIADMAAELEACGIARRHEGALIIDVAKSGDKTEIPPLLLEKSDGAATYGTTDLATLLDRFQPKDGSAPIDKAVYIVDQRQNLHFVQTFRAALKAGIVPSLDAVNHAGFGTMNGPDGKPFKTRSGGVMRLEDLIERVERHAADRIREAGLAADFPEKEREDIAYKVGVSALIFADLQNDRMSDYIFDPERFTRFEGKTGPYLLYSVVRMGAILARASAKGIEQGAFFSPEHKGAECKDIEASERALMLTLQFFPHAVMRAAEEHSPQAIAQYAYDLSQSFNTFYQAQHILSETNKSRRDRWLGCVCLCRGVLQKCLSLLNMPVPKRM